MDQTGDRQPPSEDEQSQLPTEIVRNHPPAQADPGYQPTQAAPGYQPPQAAPGYQPSHAGPADEATVVGPAYTPTHAKPPGWQAPPVPPYPRAQAGPSYTPTQAGPPQAGPAYTPTQAGPGQAGSTHDVPYQGGPTQAGSAYQQTQGPGYPPPPPGGGAQGAQPNSELMRYGPGVPATPPSEASQTAERIWRTGRPEEPARRPRRWRALAGTALTVILLATTGVVLYLRFHHAPFHVTAVKITQQTPNGCGVNVTGQISTNGSAGTVSYQWLFQPDSQAPQPLSQSVVAGQDAVFVTVAVQGSGHGSASRKVTLQVLGPDKHADSISVTLRC